MLEDHLDQLAARLNSLKGYWATREDCWPQGYKDGEEPGKGAYLLRYGKTTDEMVNNLVVMGDLGTTWEPWRAYPTERRATITGTDLEADLATLKADADDHYGVT
ncbi:MAG: hypothetical protein ACYTG0_41880 [Planctomycetota bacterium]|jgi:hypothetical protein